jgi:hypothetical protein
MPLIIAELNRGFRELEHVVHGLESLAQEQLAHEMQLFGEEQVQFAQSMIGTYENEGNWPQLSEVTQADRVRLGFPPNEPLLRTGDLRDSYSYELIVTPLDVVLMVGSDDVRAVYTELGTEAMPPRPVLTPTMNHFADEMGDILGEKVASALFARLDGIFSRL